ncbi:putative thebaine 6-O-demethylase [Helianthus anomalus]
MDGNWMSGKPLPNSFIVNIGDTLEVIYFVQVTLLENCYYSYTFPTNENADTFSTKFRRKKKGS